MAEPTQDVVERYAVLRKSVRGYEGEVGNPHIPFAEVYDALVDAREGIRKAAKAYEVWGEQDIEFHQAMADMAALVPAKPSSKGGCG